MQYTPTSWDNLGYDLRELFLKIVCAPNLGNDYPSSEIRPALKTTILKMAEGISKEEVRDILEQEQRYAPELISTCLNFVNYQRKLCTDNGTDIQREGFQVGSPWHGDILQAPVLFLSVNPGVTHRCLFPRWHPENDKFTLGGTALGNDEEFYFEGVPLTDHSGQAFKNSITPEGIYDFFTNRFQTSRITPSGVNAWIIQDEKIGCKTDAQKGMLVAGKQGGVPYWNGMRKFMYELLVKILTDGEKNNLPGLSNEDITKKLMRSVLSAEIIFWGSQNEKGTESLKTRKYFWKSSVLPMLKHCKARIILLVGGKVREAFNSLSGFSIENSGVMITYISGRKFCVAAIDHPGKWGENGNPPQLNYDSVIDAIINMSNNETDLQAALNEIKHLSYEL